MRHQSPSATHLVLRMRQVGLRGIAHVQLLRQRKDTGSLSHRLAYVAYAPCVDRWLCVKERTRHVCTYSPLLSCGCLLHISVLKCCQCVPMRSFGRLLADVFLMSIDRLAMLGFVAAISAEFASHKGLLQQYRMAPLPIAAVFLLFTIASLIPISKVRAPSQ